MQWSSFRYEWSQGCSNCPCRAVIPPVSQQQLCFRLMQSLGDYDGAWPQQAFSSAPSAQADHLAGLQQAHQIRPRSRECSIPETSPDSESSNNTSLHSPLHEVQPHSRPQRLLWSCKIQSEHSSSKCHHTTAIVLAGNTHQPLAKYLMWVDLSHLKQAAHLTRDSDCLVLATLSKTAHFTLALSPSGATGVHTTHFTLMIECWISAIDSIANFADAPTQKAITAWILVARWILQGLREKLTSFTKLCRHYSNVFTPAMILNCMPNFLAPVVLSNGSSSRLCHQDLLLYLKAREPLKLLWQVLPALQHYDHRFAVQVQEACDRTQHEWTSLYEHFRQGQRLMVAMQHSLTQRTNLGARRLLELSLLPLVEQIVNQLQRATFQYYNV